MKNSEIWAFLGGAIVGAAVALLLAPEKGEVTRRKIKELYNSDSDDDYFREHIRSHDLYEQEQREQE